MRVFNVVELGSYEDFTVREAYEQYTIYYWRKARDNQGTDPWAPWNSDVLGAALVLNDAPIMLADERLIKELVMRQGYVTEARVLQLIAENGGGGEGPPKKQILIRDNWQTEGPIKNRAIEECFMAESTWSNASFGSVVTTDGVSALIGPASGRAAFGDGNSQISEPIRLDVVITELSGSTFEDDPFLTITPSSTGGDYITMWGNANTGSLTVGVQRGFGALNIKNTKTFSGLTGSVELTILIYPTSLQVSVGDQYFNMTEISKNAMPSVSGFSFSIADGVKLGSLNVQRVAYVNAV